MKTLIFIHGAHSFLDDAAYVHFLQNEYISRYTKPWDDVEQSDYRRIIAKKWKEQGGQVWYPAMPNKQNARYRDWKLVFEGILAQLNPDDELTLVGGSLGGCFLLKYFSDSFAIAKNKAIQVSNQERGLLPGIKFRAGSTSQGQELQIKQIHLVATCISEGDFTAPTNYDFLRNLGNRVHIWHAEDDMVVTFAVGQELSRTLPDAVFHPFSPERGYGHFHGIPVFPELGNELLET